MKDETKKKLILFASGFLTGIAVVAFIAWKILKHKENQRDALLIVESNHPEKESILAKLDVAAGTIEDQAESLCEAVEEQEKEEIINAFHSIFGLDRALTGSDSEHPLDND
jgi:hypothetical protein